MEDLTDRVFRIACLLLLGVFALLCLAAVLVVGSWILGFVAEGLHALVG